MKVVRTGVFETNSSSCHSLIVCDKDDYEADDSFIYYDDVYTMKSFKEAINKWLKSLKSESSKEEYKDIDKRIDKIWDAYKEFESNLQSIYDDIDESLSPYKDSIDDELDYIQKKMPDFEKYVKTHNYFKKYNDLSETDKSICSELYENTYSIDEWFERENECFETYEESYTSKSGDKIIIFGSYGHD